MDDRTAAPTVFRQRWLGLVHVHGKLAGASLVALAAMIPFWQAVLPLLLLIASVSLVFQHRKDRSSSSWHAWTTLLPFAIAVYLLHVVGMIWSADQAFGWFDLQIKAPLLMLPLLMLWLPRKAWVGRDVLLGVFSIACALAVVICVVYASWRIMYGSELQPEQVVFSSAWSLFLHPSYFAWYLCFALAAWCLLPLPRALPTWIDRTILALLVLGVVLCGSKIGWVLMGVELIALLALCWRAQRVRTTLLGGLLGFVIGVVALVAASPYARDRVQEVWRASTAEEHDAASATSSEVRWLTWASARELFTEHPLIGTGTGDIKNELMRVYGEHGYTTATEHQLNAHNQFLQTFACLGAVGGLTLCIMVLAPFCGRPRDALSLLFFALCAMNWIVESMLEVQSGVVFFSFFACVLLWDGPNNEQ